MDFSVGIQTPTNIAGFNPPLAVSPGELLELDAAESDMAAYNWTVQGGTILGSSSQSHVTIQVDQCNGQVQNGWINIQLSYTNACGTGNYGEYTTIDCSTGGVSFYSAYPNPANDELNVRYKPDNKAVRNAAQTGEIPVFEAMLIDKEGKVLRTTKSNKGQESITLVTKEIANGMYFLHITAGKNVEKRQIIIQH